MYIKDYDTYAYQGAPMTMADANRQATQNIAKYYDIPLTAIHMMCMEDHHYNIYEDK